MCKLILLCKLKLWYAYAKTLAEKEAWKIAKEKAMDLVVVNPSFVVGPLLAPQPTSTLLLILGIIKGFDFRLKFMHNFEPLIDAKASCGK